MRASEADVNRQETVVTERKDRVQDGEECRCKALGGCNSQSLAAGNNCASGAAFPNAVERSVVLCNTESDRHSKKTRLSCCQGGLGKLAQPSLVGSNHQVVGSAPY